MRSVSSPFETVVVVRAVVYLLTFLLYIWMNTLTQNVEALIQDGMNFLCETSGSKC